MAETNLTPEEIKVQGVRKSIIEERLNIYRRKVYGLTENDVKDLEEQLLIGCDTVTEEWVDEDGNLRITKEFQDESLASEYYKLDSIIYDYNNITNSDFFFREEEDGSLVLCLTENLNDQKISDTLEDMGETKKVNYNIFYGNNEDVYGYDEDTLWILSRVVIGGLSSIKDLCALDILAFPYVPPQLSL